jgi:hypothetical protein
VQRAVQLGDVSSDPRADVRVAAVVLGGVDVQAADDLLGTRPQHGEREPGALGEVARVPLQVSPVGLKRHPLDWRPAPRRYARRRADVRDARHPSRVVGFVVLNAQGHELKLRQLELTRHVEVLGHK